MWKILQDNLNSAIISQMQETPDQYWGIGTYGLRCNAKFFFTFIFHTAKKNFVIFRNGFMIFRNPFHCRYKELIIFVIVYFLLHCLPYSVFLCVCNVNFEEIVLYSMMLNPQLVPLVTTIQVTQDDYNSEINYNSYNSGLFEHTFQ